ncbi:hypothetical protein CCACVL1_07189 [Corchorus capsularis]|uniref:Uncharacterized protein n=1 Tax=Corchorus capsularis TaxID=210143 RepID=A0A1R3J8S3_COCAP|nr:hypothetical protein CCACVL1_07189 [Corchorus capsularis]
MGVVEGRDYLDDLEFIVLHCGGNSGGNEKESREYCDEFDMEESGNDDSDYIQYLTDEGLLSNEADSDYEFYLNKLGLNGESSSSEIPSEEVERMRTSNRDLESEKAKVPECSAGLSKKAKAVKKVSKIGDGGSKGIVRDVLSKARKGMVAVDEIREVDEDEDDSMPCKSNGEPSKENDSVNLDETYHLKIVAKKEKKRKAVETNSDTSGDCSEKLFLEKQAEKDEDEDEDAMPCESSGEPLKKMNCVMIDKSRDEHQNSLTKQGRKAKAVSKLLNSGDKRSKSKIRDVLSEGRKNVVNEVEIKEEEEDEDDAMPCKSSREPLKNSNYRHLNSLAKQGKNMVFSHEIDLKSIHQKDDNSSSDSEMIILEEIPFDEGGYTPFVSSKCYQSLVYIFSLQLSVIAPVLVFYFF